MSHEVGVCRIFATTVGTAVLNIANVFRFGRDGATFVVRDAPLLLIFLCSLVSAMLARVVQNLCEARDVTDINEIGVI